MFKHIRSKMLIVVGSLAFINIAVTCVAGIYLGRKFVDTQTKEKIYVEQKAQTQYLEQMIQSAQKAANSAAIMMEYTYQEVPVGQYNHILKDNFEHTKDLFGVGFWFEPNSFEKDTKRVGKYIYRSEEKIMTTDIYESADYNYLKQDYYEKVKNTHKMQFLGPYYDEKLDKTFLTCSVPILTEDQQFRGCVTVDIDFETWEKDILEYNKTHNNRLYIMDSNGEYIIEPTNISQTTKNALKSKSYEKTLDKILKQDAGKTYFTYGQKKYNLYYESIPELNWTLLFELSDDELNRPVFMYQLIVFAIGFTVAFISCGFLVLFISKQVIYPLCLLEEECIEDGDEQEDKKLEDELTGRSDEFSRIGFALISMKERMKTYQKELENTILELTASGEEIQRQNESLTIQEKKLKEANQYNLAIVQAIPDMIFLLSSKGKFLDVQGNDKDLYVPKEQFLGKYISDIMPKEIALQAMDKIEECMKTKQTQVLEYALANEDTEGYFELRIAHFVKGELVGIVRNITQEHHRTLEIEYLNFHDQLTGLYNRRYYEQILKSDTYFEEIDKGGIIFADLNGLKLVNDSFGHEAGDEFLVRFAIILRKSRFSNEIISRIGGDEFTIFVKNQDETSIKEFIYEVEEECKNEKVHGIVLSASFGYKVFENNTNHVTDFVKMAEEYMYRAKMFDAKKRQRKTMEIIIQTLQENNPIERMHANRVIELSLQIASKLDLSIQETELLKKAAQYHDIGKIGISKDILNSSKSYNVTEYEIVQKHPEIGYRILQSIVQLKDISEYVLYHHERWDGSGYPKGLKGEKIPLFSRIICLADAYDAMVSERKYKQTLTKEEAILEMKQNASKQFDPKLVDILIQQL